MLDNYHHGYDDYHNRELTLEKAAYTVLPLLGNHLIKKHPALVLAVVLADVAIEVNRHRKSKKKFGELVLLKTD